ETEKDIDAAALGCRPGAVLVPVRDYNTLTQLDWVLSQPESEERDVVVLTVRVLGSGQHGTPGIGDGQMFSEYEQHLFTRVVAVAERHGRKVTLLVTPGTNVFDALAQSAVQLRAGVIVVGESEVMTPERQAMLIGEAWDRAPHDMELATRFVVLCKDGSVKRFSLGAHTPELSSADIERIHALWVEAVKVVGPEIHHRDIVTAALAAFEHDIRGERRQAVIDRLRSSIPRS
ncbi:MAG: APC family permease, partial [Vicinamibacterales bacterium]